MPGRGVTQIGFGGVARWLGPSGGGDRKGFGGRFDERRLTGRTVGRYLRTLADRSMHSSGLGGNVHASIARRPSALTFQAWADPRFQAWADRRPSGGDERDAEPRTLSSGRAAGQPVAGGRCLRLVGCREKPSSYDLTCLSACELSTLQIVTFRDLSRLCLAPRFASTRLTSMSDTPRSYVARQRRTNAARPRRGQPPEFRTGRRRRSPRGSLLGPAASGRPRAPTSVSTRRVIRRWQPLISTLPLNHRRQQPLHVPLALDRPDGSACATDRRRPRRWAARVYAPQPRHTPTYRALTACPFSPVGS
jgi:hypothetical protein